MSAVLYDPEVTPITWFLEAVCQGLLIALVLLVAGWVGDCMHQCPDIDIDRGRGARRHDDEDR